MKAPMLTVLTWLWHDPACMTKYEPWHVRRWAEQIESHLTLPHRLAVITDASMGKSDYFSGVENIPLWDDWREFRHPAWPEHYPQCWHRLKAFSAEMREILGPRFVSIDLDCVVTGSLDPLLSRTEDFIICGRAPINPGDEYNPYQASMWMMDAGARRQVWDSFEGAGSVDLAAGEPLARYYVATDQGWIYFCLGTGEASWTMNDGVYTWKWLKRNGKADNLPENARIVFFPGKEKPWNIKNAPGWVKK